MSESPPNNTSTSLRQPKCHHLLWVCCSSERENVNIHPCLCCLIIVATISVDSDEVERFGNNGYIVMLWHKFFGNDRVVNDNQEFLVNLSERCPCLSLLKGQQYLVSGVVRRFGSTPRLAIHDGSLVMPYNSFVDIKAAVNTIVGCNTAGDK